MASGKTGGERVKANRLRKALALGTISEIDRLWLDDYDETNKRRGKRPPPPKSYGRSGSRTKVQRSETIEEEHAAEGTGSAAATAAGAVLQVREEGRQLDKILTVGTDQLKTAVETYKSMVDQLLAGFKTLHDSNVDLIKSRNAEMLRAAEVEAAMIEQDKKSGGDDMKEIAMVAIAQHLGIDLSAVMGAAGKPANGAPKPKAG